MFRSQVSKGAEKDLSLIRRGGCSGVFSTESLEVMSGAHGRSLSLKLFRNPTWLVRKATKHRECSKHGSSEDEQEGITVVHRKSESDVETQVCGVSLPTQTADLFQRLLLYDL